jgi:hypothetical protein
MIMTREKPYALLTPSPISDTRWSTGTMYFLPGYGFPPRTTCEFSKKGNYCFLVFDVFTFAQNPGYSGYKVTRIKKEIEFKGR